MLVDSESVQTQGRTSHFHVVIRYRCWSGEEPLSVCDYSFYQLNTIFQTLQTTTVAAQASVSRADMSVVTAVRNVFALCQGLSRITFLNLILIVHSIYWGCFIPGRRFLDHVRPTRTHTMPTYSTLSSNNSLRKAAHSLDLSPDLLNQVIEDPTHIRSGKLNVTAHQGDVLLSGYISGFRTMFILNASLAAFAALAAFFMIKHKELIRDDDAKRKAEAKKKEEEEMKALKKEGDKTVSTARNDMALKDTAIRRPPVNVS